MTTSTYLIRITRLLGFLDAYVGMHGGAPAIAMGFAWNLLAIDTKIRRWRCMQNRFEVRNCPGTRGSDIVQA